MLKILEKQREIGSKAEDKTVEREIERIQKTKYGYLWKGVRRISTKNASEGYDIISYDADKVTTRHDRFIEVKGTTNSKMIFYWSENEIKVAEEKREKYWLYLWVNFGKKNERLLEPIQNPYEKIWLNDSIEKKTQK